MRQASRTRWPFRVAGRRDILASPPSFALLAESVGSVRTLEELVPRVREVPETVTGMESVCLTAIDEGVVAADEPIDADVLIARADAAMYEAKRASRASR
jgi:hypothetical protein